MADSPEPIHILMLEDVPADAELAERQLQREGVHFTTHRVETREGFEEALQTMLPDLVLADYSLPAFDGLEALALTREHDRELPFIFLTGALGEELAIETLRRGATDYVLKDHLTRLVPAVRRAMTEVKVRRERREAEQALRRSEERYRMALLGSAAGVWDCNLKEGSIFISSVGKTILGLGHIAGFENLRHFLHAVHILDRKHFWRDVRAHLKGDAAYLTGEYRVRQSENNFRTVSVSGRAFWDQNAQPYRLIGTLKEVPQDRPRTEREADWDVLDDPLFGASGVRRIHVPSPREELEIVGKYISTVMSDVAGQQENLKRQEQRLSENEKLLTVGRLAASVAHEIRNPLTAIRMRLFSFKSAVKEDDGLAEDFRVISDEIQHLEKIITEFLEFSRPKEPAPQPLDAAAVLTETIALLQHQTREKKIEIVRSGNDVPPVMADRDQIKQVFINLLKNSIRAMEPGGTIELRTRVADEETAPNMVKLTFSDTGHGIPEQVRERIFEPFYSTHQDGSGLGLCTSARILQAHGGRLTLERSSPEGTVFAVFLPQAAPDT